MRNPDYLMFKKHRRKFLTQILALPTMRFLPIAILPFVSVSETKSGWVLRSDDI